MRASFYHGDRTFRTGSAPMPTPAPGEALLRVRRVGICGPTCTFFRGISITVCRGAASSVTRRSERS